MGKLKAHFKKCPGCNDFYESKNSSARVALKFRVAGKDLDFCPSCTARERFKLDQWLSTENKKMRSIPLYDPKTGRRTLVILTDPTDYQQEQSQGEEHVGEEGLLLAPTQADIERHTKPE